MATVTTEPVAWRFRFANDEQDEWTYEEHEPSFIAEVRPIMLVEPLFTSEALATARAEGKAEGMDAGMRKAAERLSKRRDAIFDEYGDYEPDTNVTNLPEWAEAVTDELEEARAAILAAIPAPAESAAPEQGEGGDLSEDEITQYLAGLATGGGRHVQVMRRALAELRRHRASRLRAPDGGRETVAAADERAVERKAIELATAANMIWEELEDYGSGGENRTTYRKLAVSRLRAPDGEGV